MVSIRSFIRGAALGRLAILAKGPERPRPYVGPVTSADAAGSALLAAPGLDASMVTGEQHLRDPPAAVLGGPRVVRILDTAVEFGGEGLNAGTVLAAERSGQRPRHCVEHDHRGQLASGKHV